MSNKYIQIPESISFNCITNKNFTLSSSQYMDLIMPNDNYMLVRDFLSRNLKRSDLGKEVGSINYIKKSPYYFLRTRALQSHSFLPNITSAVPVMPKVFINQNLKEGDVLISKDSNIGEIVILDKDYKNFMTSSAIYKLPIKKDKYYLLACIKHKLFREQLDFIVPKGATIRHAKTDFLDCKIPIPKKNTEKIMKYVSVLTEAIINKEKLIKQRHESILNTIEEELENNQNQDSFEFKQPCINDLIKTSRLDTSLYTESFKFLDFKIKNYKNGYKSFKELKYKITRGQNLQISNIGKSIYSDVANPNYYKLILSKYFTEYLTLSEVSYIGNIRDLKVIKKGEIIFSARGDLGRVIVQCEDEEKLITNIDNLHLTNLEKPLFNNIYTGLFLNYLRIKGYLSKISITGSGADSFTKYQFDLLPVPTFSENKQKKISSFYYNPKAINYYKKATLENYLELDNKFNEEAGIYELDKSAKQLKKRLNEVIDLIANNKDVELKFN